MAKKMGKGTRLIDGLPVVDAPKNAAITFTVNKADVRGSKSMDPRSCAAALAISREYKTQAIVHISRTYVKSEDGKAWIRYKTPESISREITSFDRGHSFEPGEYYVTPLPASERLGAYTHKSGQRNGAGNQKRMPQHKTVMVREEAKNR